MIKFGVKAALPRSFSRLESETSQLQMNHVGESCSSIQVTHLSASMQGRVPAATLLGADGCAASNDVLKVGGLY